MATIATISFSSSTKPTPLLQPTTTPHHPFPSTSLSLPRPPHHVTIARAAASMVAEEVGQEFKLQVRPCELYVCNLPRSCDVEGLLELFKPFGGVDSVEICRNSETGISKGCGFVTMSSLAEARAVITALDGSDHSGREMRVRFSADMVSGRKNITAQNTPPKRNMIFESPHKAYVGNISWSVRPEDLREHFSQFGTVVSARLLYDRKDGKNRVYGFVSFSLADELKAAVAASGTEFRGRPMMIREVVKAD